MDTPIACTLGSGDYAERTAGLAELAAAALRSREPIDGGERLIFEPGQRTAERLRDAVAAERRCCAFLTMDLREADGRIELRITGPEGAEPIIGALFA
jgi:hypothetical protein